MPLMIEPWTEVALVDRSSYKTLVYDILYTSSFSLEHIIEGVAMLLEPKFISSLHISERKLDSSERVIFCCVDNNVRIFETCNWTCSRNKISREPIIPAFKAICGVIFVTNELIVVYVSQDLLAEHSSLLIIEMF